MSSEHIIYSSPVVATLKLEPLDRWYIEQESTAKATIYWFATGHKPTIDLLFLSAAHRTHVQMLYNLHQAPPLFRNLDN